MKKIKEVLTPDDDLVQAYVTYSMLIGWTCNHCKKENFSAGFMTPSIMRLECKGCKRISMVDTRLTIHR